MTNFHFAKIIAGVSPTLAKETVLSKIINMVDIFKISLWGGFDDNNKKYIDTLMKLDNSKTIMLETRWNDIKAKNILDIIVKEKQEIEIEFSEYAQESNQRIFVDASFVWELEKWQIIQFEQSGVEVKVKETREDIAVTEVISGGTIMQQDRVIFPGYKANIPFLTERDKKDILWGLSYGIHVVAAAQVTNKNDLFELKEFMAAQNADKIKILAKIENEEGRENFKEILEVADGIILVREKHDEKMLSENEIISSCKNNGKPIIITFNGWFQKNGKKSKIDEKEIKKYSKERIDCYMLNTFLKEEDTINEITELSDILERNGLEVKKETKKPFYEETDNFLVRDYIIYNAYRITNEIEVKAIVSFTENWYTSARLSTLSPEVPVIAFTKIDETYRYINMLRWVRGYKISQSFSYENLKRVGKEMIRIIFKGNISLDDKIIIVQANEIVKDEKTGMINGLELYKFKNI